VTFIGTHCRDSKLRRHGEQRGTDDRLVMRQ
jgi:hypothetical protein